MTSITPEELEAFLDAEGPDVSVRLRRLPSGSLLFDVRRQGLRASLEGTPDGRWGVSAEAGAHELFMHGHPQVFDSYDDAVAELVAVVRAAASET